MNANELKNLKRKQLQTIAMSHGIRANMKSGAIIDILFKRYPNGVLPHPSESDVAAPKGKAPERAPTPEPSSPRGSSPAFAHAVADRPGSGTEEKVQNPSGSQPQDTSAKKQHEASREQERNTENFHCAQHPQSLAVFTLSKNDAAVTQDHQEHSTASSASAAAGTIPSTVANSSMFPPGTEVFSASTGVPRHACAWQTSKWHGGYSFPPVQVASAQQIPYAMAASIAGGSVPINAAAGPSTHPQSRATARTSATSSFWDTAPPLVAPIVADDSLDDWDNTSSSVPRVPSPVAVDADQILATDKQLYEAVCKMANVARFREEVNTDLDAMEEDSTRMKNSLMGLGTLVRQERAHFQRIRAYIDHVHPKLVPRWREEVIWDKACPTHPDEDDNLIEYDTDDEDAPQPPQEMTRWHRKPANTQSQPEALVAIEDARKSTSEPNEEHTVTPPPQTPKRCRSDENDPPLRATKKKRGSAGATPAPARFTRSAAKKVVAEQRILGGVHEDEEEEQDMISVLSILTQAVEDEPDM
ncbi:hypothetical protein C8Q80DRAFT_491210 [Daedaleopsis nitida]|nr:hypothetical protein C8Q80DRAFT_491210 [Daedaleopsis nitida]